MIKRIVMWTVKGNDRQQIQNNAKRIKNLLETMRGKIPGLLELEVGINIHEADDACHIAFTTIFEDETALDTYYHHKDHEKIKPEIASLRLQRFAVAYSIS